LARVEADSLRDPVDIYLASSLGLARAVEEVLTSRGVDYVVQVEFLGRTTLFGSQRHAAAFYVSAHQAEYCRSLLRAGDLAHGVVEDEQRKDE
jgi:hypothetical protein